MASAERLRVVQQAVADVLGVSADSVGENDDLVELHDMDSLELMDIGVRIEKTLSTRLHVEDLMSVRTVGQVVAYLDQLEGKA